MREGGRLVGYGMASSYYPTKQMPAAARITLGPDGRAVVQTASHEIGQGMITALTQIAAETLGLELAAVRLEWGDTRLPYGGMTGASMTTLANGAAIREAGELVLKALYKRVGHDKASPLHGQPAKALRVEQGLIVGPDGNRRAGGRRHGALPRRAPERRSRYRAHVRAQQVRAGGVWGRSS